MRFLSRYLSLATVSVAALLAACGGGGGGGGSSGPGPGPGPGGTGTLKIGLTDAPACGYDEVHVTVQRVRVHQSATAAENDSGWAELVLAPARRIDLLALNNGVVEELGQASVPSGRYEQLQLVLLVNSPGSPLVNAVTPSSTGAETPLATPTAMLGGLKVAVVIDVAANQTADYVIDFDACKSVVRMGANGPYNLKPVLSVIPRVNSAGMRVTGYVATALAPETTRVSLQANGVEVKSTPPDATGRFTLYPVSAGTYDLVVSTVDRVPAIVTGVVVTNSAPTPVTDAANPINPPAATPRTIQGLVTTGTTPIDATVDIVKKYSGGPNVVVSSLPVNGSTGEFSRTVSSGAPVRASASATFPLVFTVDPAVPTGNYTINARAGGTTQSRDVDVSTQDRTSQNIAFP